MALPSFPAPASGEELGRLRSWVAQYFPVYEVRLTPHSVLLLVHADPATLETRFDALRRDLWEKQYIPQVRYERGEYVVEVIRRPPRSTWGLWVNLALLLVTCLTTVTAGAIFWLAYRGGSALSAPDFLYGGFYFGLPLMAILGFHELAHFVVARRHRVEASLPYFLPVPPPYLLFGTFGAFISLREPIPSKKALLDIGAAGPLAGFALAVPITLSGLVLSAHSPTLPVTNCGPVVLGVPFGNLLIGTSFLWDLIGLFIPGPIHNLQPLALAGWVGLLVTAMNLLPAGQLDGGHVFRALFGARATWVSVAAVGILFFLGIFYYPGWLIFAFLIFLLGVRHPPPLNDLTPLDGRRMVVGALAAVVLVGGFVVVPIAEPTGSFAIANHGSTNGPEIAGSGMSGNLSLTLVNQDVVTYGFLLSGKVTAVVADVNGSAQPLDPAEFQAFVANSSWTVTTPNGNESSFPTTASFTLSEAEYTAVAPNHNATFLVAYSNPEQATVYIELTALALCSSGSSQSATYLVS